MTPDPQESDDLYPGLSVNDHRVTGSITVGCTRLPLWAFTGAAITHGWDYVEEGWEPSAYGFTDRDLGHFLYLLLEQRKEFARLLLVLADAERSSESRRNGRHWLAVKKQRRRVASQLRRCLAELSDA